MKFEPYFKGLLLSLQASSTSVLINRGGSELNKSRGWGGGAETEPFQFTRERSPSWPKSPHLSALNRSHTERRLSWPVAKRKGVPHKDLVPFLNGVQTGFGASSFIHSLT